ncbi:MAG: hypothetical protein GF411_08695 [Candidatus Lokiarchaeota archaeon]|nr:hypothetical protein [Candidatus Lokiarchaeota archaeon]
MKKEKNDRIIVTVLCFLMAVVVMVGVTYYSFVTKTFTEWKYGYEPRVDEKLELIRKDIAELKKELAKIKEKQNRQ